MKDIQMGPMWKNPALINAMSNLNHMIKRVFVTNQVNEQDVFCLEFVSDGEFKRINVNSAFPTLQMRPAFATAKNGVQIWMSLIEKAYAKTLGSYSQLEGNDYTDCAMRDLSCAPSFNHDDPKAYFG